MAYPEPSINDCGAPWNEEEVENEDRETIIICGCSRCKKRRRDEADWDRDL